MAGQQFNYQDTFGSLSLCACTDCQSIYSPAAYLTDILMFLSPDQRKALMQASRRPDLGQIELSCANTGTALPHLDLVNEVLEYAVAVKPVEPPTAPAAGWPQTNGTAADLAVTPEHLNDDAYAVLRGEIYSWLLPFDLWAEEARSYLEKLGVPRAALMEVFRDQQNVTFDKLTPDAAGSGAAIDIAAESLRLTPVERRLITARLSVKPVRVATTAALAQLSGLQTVDGVALADGDRVLVKDQAAGGSAANGIYVAHAGAWERAADANGTTLHDGAFVPVAAGTQQGTSWVLTTKEPFVVDTDPLVFAAFKAAGDPDTLEYDPLRAWYGAGDATAATDFPSLKSKVGHFMDRSGLEYQDVVDLLHTRYINPGTVAADIVTIAFAGGGGCNVNTATFSPALGDPAMSRIHRFTRLRRKLGWTACELDQAITALGAPDLTDRFLLQLATLQRLPGRAGLPLLELLAWWGALDTSLEADGSPSYYERAFQNPAVLAVAGADAFGLNATRTELAAAATTPPTMIADAHKPGIISVLGISSDDLELLLTRLRGTAGQSPLNLASLSWLFRHASLARALGVSIDDLISLLDLSGIDPFNRDLPWDTLRFMTASQQVTASGFSMAELNYLLRDVANVVDGLAPPDDLVDVALRDVQTGLRKIAGDTAAALDPAGALLRAKLAALLPAADVDAAMTFVTNGVAPDQRQFIVDHFAFADPDDALDKLVTHPLQPVEERYAYLYRWTLAEGYVVQKLAPVMQLDSTVTSILLKQGLRSPDGVRSAMAELLDAAFVAAAAPTDDAIRTFKRIWKAALVMRHLDINGDRLGTDVEPAWVCTRGATIGWLDFNALPITGGITPAAANPALFTSWRRLVDFYTVWDGLPRGLPSFFATFDVAHSGGDQATFVANVAARTGWKADDLTTLTGPNALGMVYPTDYQDERCLVRLTACARLMHKLRVAAVQVLAWRTPSPDADMARAIRQATKARLDDAAWSLQAKPVQDLLRGTRRDALVAYLLSQRGFADTNALFEWFLLDVETTPVVLTSRIKQAIGTVQLFVQRAIMNMEPGVTIAAEDATHWLTWIKSEQLWEANRKVFLYPENWIDEALLPSPTPLFAAFQNQLLQRDVTPESAEDAFRAYLAGLDQVARLEVVGMYHETPTDGGDERYHIFARTLNAPKVYFYRIHTLSTKTEATWSPWERVDLDIQGEHLIPVMFNRRLHLFWPVFTEKSDNTKGQTTATHYEIQLAWSEYKDGKWSSKRLSSPMSVEALGFGGYLTPDAGVQGDQFHGSEGDYGLRILMEQNADDLDNVHLGVQQASFTFTACGGIPVIWTGSLPSGNRLTTPPTTDVDYQEFSSTGATTGLSFELGDGSTVTVLGHRPSDFQVLVPHQEPVFNGGDSFFYQDLQRTFFARYLGSSPHTAPASPPDLSVITTIAQTFHYPAATVLPPGPDPAVLVRATRIDPESVALARVAANVGGAA